MSELIETVLAWKSSKAVGRVFAGCLTREHVLIMTEDFGHALGRPVRYQNVFIPTVCKWCEKTSGPQAAEIELSDCLVVGWEVFKVVQRRRAIC
jgi:hypothetical protein